MANANRTVLNAVIREIVSFLHCQR
jgi:hypothetical protein